MIQFPNYRARRSVLVLVLIFLLVLSIGVLGHYDYQHETDLWEYYQYLDWEYSQVSSHDHPEVFTAGM